MSVPSSSITRRRPSSIASVMLRHLVGDPTAGRPSLVGADVGEALAVRGAAVARAEAAAGNPDVAGQRRQAADGARCPSSRRCPCACELPPSTIIAGRVVA